MDSLASLNRFNKKKDEGKPSDIETVFYLFWDKGISYDEFCDLPIPYIFSVIKTLSYVRELERKEMEKNKPKKGKRGGVL